MSKLTLIHALPQINNYHCSGVSNLEALMTPVYSCLCVGTCHVWHVNSSYNIFKKSWSDQNNVLKQHKHRSVFDGVLYDMAGWIVPSAKGFGLSSYTWQVVSDSFLHYRTLLFMHINTKALTRVRHSEWTVLYNSSLHLGFIAPKSSWYLKHSGSRLAEGRTG